MRDNLFQQIKEIENKIEILPVWKKFDEDVDLREAEDFDQLQEMSMDKIVKMPIEVIRMVGL